MIWLEQSYYANIFVYSGNGHQNLTTLVEGGSTAGLGAPYSVKVDDGAVLVAYAIYSPATITKPASYNGSFTFSYQVNAESYPWYEKMFLGKPRWVYYLGLSGLCISTFLVLLLFTIPCIACFVWVFRNKKRNAVKFDQ